MVLKLQRMNKRPKWPQSCTWVPLFGMEHMLILICPKTQTWRRMLSTWYLPPFRFCWIPVSSYREEVEVSRSIGSQSSYLDFSIGTKSTNLVEDVEILLPVKFRWILLSGFREVEKVSANQRPGPPSWFSVRPKETNLVEDFEILLPAKFFLIPLSGFREEFKNVSANQRPGRPSWFSDRPEKHKFGRRRWDIASLLVSLISVQKKSKMWKVNDDGQRVITMVHFSLLLRCTKNGSLPQLKGFTTWILVHVVLLKKGLWQCQL